MIGHLSYNLELQPVISQTQPSLSVFRPPKSYIQIHYTLRYSTHLLEKQKIKSTLYIKHINWNGVILTLNLI